MQQRQRLVEVFGHQVELRPLQVVNVTKGRVHEDPLPILAAVVAGQVYGHHVKGALAEHNLQGFAGQFGISFALTL